MTLSRFNNPSLIFSFHFTESEEQLCVEINVGSNRKFPFAVALNGVPFHPHVLFNKIRFVYTYVNIMTDIEMTF